MVSLLLAYRYAFFALFTICSAVICAVAVWNFTLGRNAGLNPQVDIFLAFLGALGVVVILPIIFLDVFRRNALPTRVWVECAWVALFWMLYLAGASAATSLLPDMMCSPLAPLFPGYTASSCTSMKVLLVFSWLCMTALFVYLVALVVSALMHHDDDPSVWQSSVWQSSVWQSSVRFFPWYATRASLPSAPSSPTKTWQRPFALVAPQPKHAVNQAAVARMDVPADVEAPPAVSRIVPMRQATRPFISQPQLVASMYPPHIQAKMPETTRGTAQVLAPAPPPLGDWPRSAQQQRQQRSARKPAPSATSVSTPTDSRRGSPTSRRPPPLDLTKISAYNRVDERRN
ncbi:unnamed protein product [Somion occarium]|uniref:MARVEL domain-containing protein n=1 Tax=Somion occarium TaxID=3059160 RepID=A0ABP1DAP5_9APHY